MKIISLMIILQIALYPFSLRAEDAPAATTDSTDAGSDLKSPDTEVVDASMFNKTGGEIWLKRRASVSPLFGTVFNDVYSNILNFGAAFNYFLTERSGVEMSIYLSSSSSNDVVNYYTNKFFNTPERNVPKFFVGFDYTYALVTAKFNFRDAKQIPYVLRVEPGLGATFLSSVSYSPPPAYGIPTQSQIAPTVSADIVQEFFMTDKLAIRLDFRNHFYPETLYDPTQGTVVRSRININSAIMLGATWYCTPTTKKFKFSECF